MRLFFCVEILIFIVMTFKQIPTIIFLLILLISCEKNENEYIPADTNESYVFRNIEFFINENSSDGNVTIQEDLPVKVYYNKTPDTVRVKIDLYNDLTEYSVFTSMNKPDINYDLSQAKISLPVEIKNGEVILGDKEWTFSFSGLEKKPCDKYLENKQYHVSPYSILSLSSNIKVDKISASYVATFVGKTSGNVVVVKGKWEGSCIKDSDMQENITRM